MKITTMPPFPEERRARTYVNPVPTTMTRFIAKMAASSESGMESNISESLPLVCTSLRPYLGK